MVTSSLAIRFGCVLLSVAFALQSMAWPANPSWMAAIQMGDMEAETGVHPLDGDIPLNSPWEVVKSTCVRLPGEELDLPRVEAMPVVVAPMVLSGEDSLLPPLPGMWNAPGDRAPPAVLKWR